MKLALDETLPRIKGNPGKLQQVFLNLFLNARDAMETGGTSGGEDHAPQDGLVRVTVADTGAGIAPENLARIFDPFFTTKGAKKGTGPGTFGELRHRAASMAAKLKSQSELGAGTRFELSFPEACAGSERARPARRPRRRWRRGAGDLAAVRSPRLPQRSSVRCSQRAVARRSAVPRRSSHNPISVIQLMASTLPDLPPDIIDAGNVRAATSW